METLSRMLRVHPRAKETPVAHIGDALDALSACIQICTSCADACISEEHVHQLRRCIRTDLDCADVCTATARILSRQSDAISELVRQQLHACVIACQACAEECQTHAKMHEHCRICAETCRHCQEACNRMLGEISSSGTIPAESFESVTTLP